MIKEYALDPQVMASWDNFRFFSSQFGCQYGRMISKFPSGWKRIVFELCQNNHGISEIQLKKIEVNLYQREFDRKFVKNSRDYVNSLGWIENALRSNQNKPFHAIISSEVRESVQLVDDIDDSNEKWKVDIGLPVPRTANHFVKVFTPFFLLANDIIFVEPHFDPHTSKWYRAFRIYFRKLFENGKRYRKIELHTSAKMTPKIFADEFIIKFEQFFTENYGIHVYLWERIDNNENFHPRYLLTEVGGLRIDYGFDDISEDETTDISLLSDIVYEKRKSNIEESSTVFNLVAKILFSKKNTRLTYSILQ
ncbi:MAG: hypothetical protein CMF23_00035 [Ignavibacteriae bacterium]|nr:hypothetical protein [Ignavibacteriota bacterium]